jgi:hypothetical protein
MRGKCQRQASRRSDYFTNQRGNTMNVRAKFRLDNVTSHSWHPIARTLKFSAQYDTSIPEDQRFQESTPSGVFEMMCTNPSALAKFELGKQYYFDITPAD